ncbi:MAG: hypothetical protein K6U02_11140 [Firmicutes bacterium]|nr:hypothetical protein [Bacillota bacterium]
MLTKRTFLAGLLGLAALTGSRAVGQEPVERILDATARVFPEVSTGVTALAVRSAPETKEYYVLRGREREVLVYDAAGQLIRRIALRLPEGSSDRAGPALLFGDDLAVEADGRLWVADRNGNALRVFSPEGVLERSLAVPQPTSLVLLPDGEVAYASMRSAKLITVLDRSGEPVREFGELADVATSQALNRFLNIGRLASDAAHNLYFSFSYVPEPTVRKYDRFGFLQMEIELATLDIQPAAAAARREIARQDGRAGIEWWPSPNNPINKIISAIGIDPYTQDVWLALGGLLMHFNAEGLRQGIYRTYTPERVRLEAVAVLVETDRLLLAGESGGVFEFPRPDKRRR